MSNLVFYAESIETLCSRNKNMFFDLMRDVYMVMKQMHQANVFVPSKMERAWTMI